MNCLKEKCKIKIGSTSIDGIHTDCYFDESYGFGLAILGKPGSGKSEYLYNYLMDVFSSDESFVFIDYVTHEGENPSSYNYLEEELIKNNKLDVIDLSKNGSSLSLHFNELDSYNTIKEDCDEMHYIERKSKLFLTLLDSLSEEPLSTIQRIYFLSASHVSLASNPHSVLSDVISCLSNHSLRAKLIESLSPCMKIYFHEDILFLDRLSSPNADEGIRKIKSILNRFDTVKECSIANRILQSNSFDNFNFNDIFKNKKSLIVRIPAYNLTEEITDFISTYHARIPLPQ